MYSIDLTKILPRDVICYIITLEKIISGEMWASLLKKKDIPFVKPLETKTLSESYNLLFKSKSKARNETCDFPKYREKLTFRMFFNPILSFDNLPEITHHSKMNEIHEVTFFYGGRTAIRISLINFLEGPAYEDDLASDEDYCEKEYFFLETKLTKEIAFECMFKFLYHSSDYTEKIGKGITIDPF